MRLLQASGEVEVGKIVVSKLQESSSFALLRKCVFVLWGAIAIAVALMLFRFLSPVETLSAFILVAIALVGTLLPPHIIGWASDKVVFILPEMILSQLRDLLLLAYGEDKYLPSRVLVKKTGHFLVFLVLGTLGGLGVYRIGVGFAAASIFLFAVITEVLQTMVDGRSADIFDLAVDWSGATIGLAAGITCAVLVKKSAS